MSLSLPDPVWVATPAALQRMASDLAHQPRIGVDTESNSLHAYREQVCLVQFSTVQTDYLLDPLALSDLSPLAPVFASVKTEKIFHASEYDIICLQRDFHFSFSNLFDTMIAARILGYEQVGLGDLLNEKFGVMVNKHNQKADWAQRPLPRPLTEYARMDTHFLVRLRDQLAAELREKSRWSLAQEDFQRACLPNGRTGADHAPPVRRIKGTQKLTARERAILQELSRWRESQAQHMNRPVFKVVGDHVLVALACNAPRTEKGLAEKGLTARQIRLFGAEMLHAIRRGAQGDPVNRSVTPRPDDAFLSRLQVLRQWRKGAAHTLQVESDIILPRQVLETIALENPRDLQALSTIMSQSPWRLANYGADIIEVLKKE